MKCYSLLFLTLLLTSLQASQPASYTNILSDMPVEFTTAKFKGVFEDKGMTSRTAQNEIKRMLEQRLITKVRQGVYKKN